MKVPFIIYDRNKGTREQHLWTQTLLLLMCYENLKREAEELSKIFNSRSAYLESVHYGRTLVTAFSWAEFGGFTYFSELHERLHDEGIYRKVNETELMVYESAINNF